MAQVIEKDQPDGAVVLGDRIEALAGACAASVAGVRLIHMHGGDRAEGVADEAMRHAISKLAHLHLPATEQSAERLQRMGEDPQSIYVVGSPAVDGLDAIEPLPESDPSRVDVIVLQHPIGESDEQECQWMRETLQATAGFSRMVLMPNHDPGREGIMRAIEELNEREELSERDESNTEVVTHLPRPHFVAKLKAARMIVGNSSAGLIEAAVCKTPCVNLGPRQAGRESPNHVVHADYGEASTRAAIEQAMSLDTQSFTHPYGNGQTGPRVAKLLADLDWDSISLRKRNAY